MSRNCVPYGISFVAEEIIPHFQPFEFFIGYSLLFHSAKIARAARRSVLLTTRFPSFLRCRVEALCAPNFFKLTKVPFLAINLIHFARNLRSCF
jgi:hypothetical protein